MRKPTKILGTIAVAAAMTGVTALPASAAAGETPATITLTASGGLSFLVTETTSALTSLGGNKTGDTAFTGSLGPASVTDARGEIVPWSVQVALSTPFVGSRLGAASLVTYTRGAVTTTGTVGAFGVGDATATTLGGAAAPVVNPVSVSGNTTASWTPTLNVTMPATSLVDTYSAVVTTSIV